MTVWEEQNQSAWDLGVHLAECGISPFESGRQAALQFPDLPDIVWEGYEHATFNEDIPEVDGASPGQDLFQLGINTILPDWTM